LLGQKRPCAKHCAQQQIARKCCATVLALEISAKSLCATVVWLKISAFCLKAKNWSKQSVEG